MSRTGTWNSRAFTLLELVVVLFILALFATIAVPRLQLFLSHGDTNKAIRQIRGVVRYLAGMSASTRVPYRLNYDLSQGVCWVSCQNGEGEFMEEREVLTRPLHLPPGVSFKDVVTPRGEYKEGVPYTQFSPTGWVENTLIHLEGSCVVTLKLLPLTGEVKIYEGYVTEEKE
ncbi:MAG: type II secretion system protein [Deltaproteobacteria bacterium]|nr:type II secretion system protein [Deltaproteobacteria bacterium]